MTAAAKLTKAQREFLQDVASGRARSCISTYKPAVRLVNDGLIEVTSRNTTGTWWLRVTEKGKEALK